MTSCERESGCHDHTVTSRALTFGSVAATRPFAGHGAQVDVDGDITLHLARKVG